MSTHLYCYDTPNLYLDYKRNAPRTYESDPYYMNIHVHNMYELDYIVSGSGYYYVEGAQYPIVSGSILLIRPIDAHKTHINTDMPYERITLHFNAALLSELDPSGTLLCFTQELPSPLLPIPSSYESFFKQLFLSLPHLAKESPAYQRSTILAILHLSLTTLRYISSTMTNISITLGVSISDTIRNILLYINAHLTEDFTLDELCKQFGISKSYLNKRFKEITGSTLWNYVLIKRLTIARQKIQNGSAIQDAYRDSGFSDYSNFYRCYVKRFGISPKEDAVQGRKAP